ncbi:YihY/virulence factor BrkB family protein [Microbacterium sp. SSW1-59]|uniref:YihY/virulence factor BrkB family protein n=1 Tax=Microbacterium xanthum TaxID=3079794 RepID=UPI002AD3385B|nr:YihY/virulence factor BrkB family protein [Microbacterium sp. SSW1-59]MDZ8201518.1 YihY/virulence factor BrkB family protein [Microbacterium sp. SSW1-59]
MRRARHGHPETPVSDEPRDLTVAEATHQEQTLRARWESTQEALRERFEQPIDRATTLTRKTLAWFPVRVWRHFLQHNGFLLAAGVSYQALFAIFATIYVAFAVAGLWLGGSPEAIQALITAINSYIPGLISDDGEGLFTTQQVTEIATSSTGVLGVTGIVALVTLIWTAIGFITFARRAVRDIFGIPPDRRSYVLLKARDLLASAIFGAALLVGSGLGFVGTWALGLLFDLLGWPTTSTIYNALGRAAALLVSFLLYSAALASLVKFLTGTSLRWRQIVPGAVLGGAAITVLQIGAGWLLIYTPSNPLLATFAIFVGLLLWFRIIGVIILVASSWMAVATMDENLPILQRTEEERLAAEHAALLTAARVRVRSARAAADTAPWYRRLAARRTLAEAEKELADVEHAAPAPVKQGSLFE